MPARTATMLCAAVVALAAILVAACAPNRANDRFVTQTILNGRGMMPAAGSTLSDEQLHDLIAYLHTL